MPPHPPASFPVRLHHDGYASLRLTLPEGSIHFDPCSSPSPTALTVLTWNEAERLEATTQALQAGSALSVAAPSPLLDWLETFGPARRVTLPGTWQSLQLEGLEYLPIPYATPIEGWRKLRSAIQDPARAVDRLRGRARRPRCAPLLTRIRRPDGWTFLHLNGALHAWTPEAWLLELAERYARPSVLLVAVDHEMEDAVLARIGVFSPEQVIVTELTQTVRKSLHLPVAPLDAMTEHLLARGYDAQLLEAGRSIELNLCAN